MWSNIIKLVSLSVLIASYLFSKGTPVLAQQCNEETVCNQPYAQTGDCKACTGMNGTQYVYTTYTCNGGEQPINSGLCNADLTLGTISNELPLNTNVNGCFLNSSAWSGFQP